MTFTVNTSAKIEYLKDQEFTFDDYTVEVTKLRKKIFCTLLKGEDGAVLKSLSFTEEEAMKNDPNADNLQWYFHCKLPENRNKKAVLYLMAQDKALYTARGIRWPDRFILRALQEDGSALLYPAPGHWNRIIHMLPRIESAVSGAYYIRRYLCRRRRFFLYR